MDGTVDIAVDTFGITYARMEVIDYRQMNQGGKGRLYIRNPRESYDLEIYTKPLQKVTWAAIIAFIILAPIVMVIAMINCKICTYNKY